MHANPVGLVQPEADHFRVKEVHKAWGLRRIMHWSLHFGEGYSITGVQLLSVFGAKATKLLCCKAACFLSAFPGP